MKILMICTEKLPVPAVKGGAIQTYIDGVSSHLSKKHDLTILGSADPSLPMDEKINNVRYVRTPGGILEDYRDGVIQFLQSEQNYDVIHIFNRPRLVLAVRECAPTARIVLSMHNDMFKREKIEPEEAEAAIEQLDKIITISNYIGTALTELFPQAAPKLKTIYSGVDINRFAAPHSKEARDMRQAIRNEHNLDGKKVILFAGRLSKNKGADILVQAMPEIAKKHPDAALVIVGSKWFSVNEVSDYVAYVRALASKLSIPVVNTGFVDPSEIQKWFAAADVFVCPSQWEEPLARVHYEAMASGLPVITTRRGGNPEVITPNKNGFIVEQPEDPQAFADLIIPLLSNPKLSKELGMNGRKLVEEKFTWDRVITDISDVWDEIHYKLENNIPVISEEKTENNEINVTEEQTSVVEQDEQNPTAIEEVVDNETMSTLDSTSEEHLNETAVENTSYTENQLATQEENTEFNNEIIIEESQEDPAAELGTTDEEQLTTNKTIDVNEEEEIDIDNHHEDKSTQSIFDILNNLSKEQDFDDFTNNLLYPLLESKKRVRNQNIFRNRTIRPNGKSKLAHKLNVKQLQLSIDHTNDQDHESTNIDVLSQVYDLINTNLITNSKENPKEFLNLINNVTTSKLLNKLMTKKSRKPSS